jgi:hypothetical protein
MNTMIEALKDLLTDDAGQFDVGFIAWLAGVVVFLVLSCVHHERFDPSQYGVGFGAILGAGGAMSWMRSRV